MTVSLPCAPKAFVHQDGLELRLGILVDGITNYAIYMLDPAGIVVSWNRGAERIKEYAPDEIIGSHFSCFYVEEDREADRPAAALRIATAEGRFEEEGWRVRKSGERLWANVVINPIVDDEGMLVGFANVTRDLTTKKKLERQLIHAEKMKAVAEITGGVAHDFNNVLNVIIGNLDSVLEGLDEQSAVMPAASDALDAALQGARLIEHFLAYFSQEDAAAETAQPWRDFVRDRSRAA